MAFLARAWIWSLCNSSKDHVAFLPINPWSMCMLQVKLVFQCLTLSGAMWSDIKNLAHMRVCCHSEFSERLHLSPYQHAVTHQKQIPTERSNPKGELCSWKIFLHQKIYQEHRVAFYKWTGSQDRNQDDTNEAKKVEIKWKWNKVSTGWNITYSHYMFSSYEDCACALVYWVDARYCSMKGKAVQTQKR